MVLPFEEVASSDEDSISITSTQPSDPEAEYNVEKILAEQIFEDGVRRYLLKWEGYPLHSATWEPAENLLGEQLLTNWEAEKREIDSGARSPFDVLEHEEAQENHIAEKWKRHRRRKAKRRKRGLPVSTSGSASDASANDVVMRDGDSEDDGPLAAARQKRVKAVVPKRKGVAVKVTKRSNRQAAAADSSSDENSEDEMSISDDSLVEEARSQQHATTNGNQTKPATSKSAARPTPARARGSGTTTAQVKAADKVIKTASSIQKPATARRTTASSASANPKPTERSLPSSSARKSAPSTATFGPTDPPPTTRLHVLPTDPPQRKSSGPVSMTLNPAKGPRTRRISESDPRHQRYANLSEQNRFLKHSRKEAAPDPNMLGTFNAVTGRFDEPVARALPATSRAADASSANTIPSVFGRRDGPAPTRQRSASPPSPKVPAASISNDDNTTTHTRVCWDWRNSTCTKPQGTCMFAHHYITCPYWKNGGCNKPEKDCKFDHREGRDPIRARWQPLNIPARQPLSVQQSPVHQAPGMSPPSVQQSPVHQMPGMSPPSVQQSPVHQVSGMSPPRANPPREEAPAPVERRSVTGPLESRPTMRKPTQPTVFSMKDIQCRDWMRGYCRFGDDCRQAHGPTDLDIRVKDVTCWHWENAECRHFDRCVFAHRLTEYRIEQPGSGVIHFKPFAADASDERNMPPPTEAAKTHHPDNSHKQRPADQFVTCHFWLNGKCKKGAKCHFAHYLTEWRAGRPGSGQVKYVPMPGDTSGKTNAASLSEAGSRRQSLNESRAVDFSDGEVMDMDDGPSTSAPATSANAVPVSRKPSSSVQRQVVEPPPAQDTNPAVIPNETLPSDALPHVSENLQTDTPITEPSSMSARDIIATNIERLLKVNDVRREDKVFIMMPESKASEIKLIAKMFEERFKQPDYKGRNCKVWTSLEPGSWEICMKSSACLLLVHPDVPLWDIPNLGKALHDRTFRFFSVNLDSASTTSDEDDSNATFRRLFPMGDVVFLTDDVFLNKPGKVLAIIDKINSSNINKPPGATRNKIATRPGIKAWLAELVINQKEGSEDPRLLMLLNEIWKLCPIEKEDERYPGHPSENADVISLAPEQLPTFQALLQTDRAQAMDYIVNWFAGWAFMNASNYRRFTVCHEEPGTGEQVLDENYNLVTIGIADPRGWGDAFKYLMVKTPDQWIEKEKEKAKVRPAPEKP